VIAEEAQSHQQTTIHITDGVLYCDAQTFAQEAYMLKVLAGGSPLTVSWQFEVQEHRAFWLNNTLASVQLSRQVLPDLVTKRWLMRNLSSGVVRYTTDVHTAMSFLTGMRHVAVLNTSLLMDDASYTIETKLYMHEGEAQVGG